ncbi:MAG: DEAD/DEAH box helicase family protein, partial [Dehalococcoidales bacterium]|nr:DEAD/DEAH box helicase family protein [Dehalococcoidales bacterium]
MSEAETRRLYIDLYLKEAGWDVLDTENVALAGKAGIEIEVQGMPNPHGIGYCDYVLYGSNGKPLAIVEVKKTSVSPENGRHQVDLYAECLKKVCGYKPVMYYTNGYTTRIIDGIYPDRTVTAFHSREELELMLQRRTRGDITDLRIDDAITNRPYQKMAITSICEWLNAKHRRGLLVMATGTGKTRTAISLVDILTRNNWVKTVLFLADRTSLVNQAKRNFAKLMPDMSVCELSAPGEKDFNARLMFCTYQTMINYIDAEDKRFTTGRFDLIIIDEAHRSIFNRYGTIFRYFDSFLIGLTATPKNEVDANTYRIFGCEAGIPNFDYSLEDAIKEKYLVGYHVINRTSKMLKEGIDYGSLTEEEKEQLDEYLEEDLPTPDFTIPGNELFKYLFNRDTCRRVLEELMQWGLRVDNGETMGKTIIFAYNHKHAQ